MKYVETHDEGAAIAVTIRIPTDRGFWMTAFNASALGASAAMLAVNAVIGVALIPTAVLLAVLIMAFANLLHVLTANMDHNATAIVEAAQHVEHLDESQIVEDNRTVRQYDAVYERAKELEILVADLAELDRADPSLGDAGLTAALTRVPHQKGKSWSQILANAKSESGDDFLAQWVKDRSIPFPEKVARQAVMYGNGSEHITYADDDFRRIALECDEMLHPDFRQQHIGNA